MKQKIYIFGLITAMIIILGTVLKINHMPGAGILISLGMMTLVCAFLPVALINHYRTEGNRQNLLLYIITWLTSAVIFTGMLFKIQHWPGAGNMIMIALPFPFVVFLPVFLGVTSRIKNFNIYNTVFVLLLLAVVSVFSLLLALDVSRDRIYDSLDLGTHYIKVSKVLDQTPVTSKNATIIKDIDDIVLIIEDYQSKILKMDGTAKEEWLADTKALKYPVSQDVVVRAMYPNGTMQTDTRLEDGLRKFIKDLNDNQDYKELSKVARQILGFNDTPSVPGEWTSSIFRSFGQSWVLVYFEGLKANLKFIKASS